VHRPVNDPEAEIRGLAARMRKLWSGQVMLPLDMLTPDERAEADRRSAEYRAVSRRLTDALLAHPAPVRLDETTWLLPDQDGDGPAFVPVSTFYTDRENRAWAENTLAYLIEVHRLRFAGRVPA
jgi:hypothetical protein